MSNQSWWLVYLSDSKLEAHKQWVESGYTSGGRLILTERNLSGANIPGANLIKAQFVKCNLSSINVRGGDLSKGALKIEGKCEFIESDLSEEFDGSKIVNEDKILTLWNKASLSI
jgi:uncharacterized protein YjbI with pentapeptide repeats